MGVINLIPMAQPDMATLQLQKYLEQNTIKHPTAMLHFERQLSDFEQGILFLCAHLVAKTDRSDDGFYYLRKSLVRAVMRQEGNHDYTRISEAVDRVSTAKIKINFLGQDRTFDHYRAPLIIGQADNEKRGVIAFEVHPRLEKLLKDPRVFSRLNIYFISALADVRRGYAFYALFKDHIDRTRAAEVTLDYWELRKYLGIDDEHYRDFKLFKRKVLKPLIEAVNERTDLSLSYEPVKTGRQLTHLKFTISKQAWQLPLFDKDFAARIVEELAKTFDGPVLESQAPEVIEVDKAEDTERKRLIDHCVKIGVTSRTVERALKKHGVQGVGEIIEQTEKRFAKLESEGQAYDEKNYLARMLNDGAGVKSAKERAKAEADKAKAAKAKKQIEQSRAVFRDAVAFQYLHDKFTDEQRNQDRALRKQLSEAENEAELKAEFAGTLDDEAKADDFENSGWSSLRVALEIRQFARNHFGVVSKSEEEFFAAYDQDFTVLGRSHEKTLNSFRLSQMNDAAQALQSFDRKALDQVAQRFF